MSRHCGNPLLRDWVKEWMDHAQLMQNKSFYTFKKAYDSLCRCPVTFSHPAESQQLEGIGVTLAKRLTDKMVLHCEEFGLPPISRSLKSKRKANTDASLDSDLPSSQPKRPKKAYVPTYRSGAYAILLCLQDMQATGRDSLTKEQICTYAQPYCTSSMTLAEPGKSYTAFNGVKTLLEKGYVYKSGRPVKYMLTDTGIEMANKLRSAGDGSQPSSSQPLSQPSSSQPLSQPSSSQPLSQAQPSESNRWAQDRWKDTLAVELTLSLDEDHLLYETLEGSNQIQPVQSKIPQDSFKGEAITKEPAYHQHDAKDRSPVVVNLDDDSDEDLLSSQHSSSKRTAEDLNNPAVFHFTYLSALKEPVRHASSAWVVLDEENTSLSYLIRFDAQQRQHPEVAYLTGIEHDGDQTLTGYLPETRAIAVCPGLPCSPLLPLHRSKEDGFWPLDSSPAEATVFPVQASDSQDTQIMSSQQRAMDQVYTDVVQLMEAENIEPWQPDEYNIELVLDSREIQTKTNRTYIQDQLTAQGIPLSTRSLDLGDVVWIARNKNSGQELFLDYVIERKRLDDLIASIKDGRFTEQKQRLKRSGAKKAMYIVEEYSREEAVNFGLQAIQTAMSSTQIIDHIFLKRTSNMDETIRYLISVHRMIERCYANRQLYPIPDHRVTSQNYLALRTEYRVQREKENTAYLISYSVYNQINSKSGSTNLHEIYLRMLMYIRGVNAEKALALIQVYPTPHRLLSAFHHASIDEAKALAKKATQHQISRRRWGAAVSQRLYEVWGALEPTHTDGFSD
ncbi:hypothetical protein BY458DRAFT_591073 [Sporodiniella umbellata]|nr:hypothetical protein BY458DRAFT_591073 [Sporodiniella umbellata]